MVYVLIVLILIFGFVVFRGAPYVPSQKRYVIEAFTKLYPLKAEDVLLDIGSGDGMVLRIAEKYCKKVIGYELNPLLVLMSRLLSINNKKIIIKLADFWLTQIPDDTTIIYLFAVTRDIKKIIKKFQNESDRLGREIRVLSYGNEFKGLKFVKKHGPYFLYQFNPLQSDKAQV